MTKFFFGLIILSFVCNGNSLKTGTYLSSKSRFILWSLTLNKENNFELKRSDCTSRDLATGTYVVQNDSLLLNYRSVYWLDDKSIRHLVDDTASIRYQLFYNSNKVIVKYPDTLILLVKLSGNSETRSVQLVRK